MLEPDNHPRKILSITEKKRTLRTQLNNNFLKFFLSPFLQEIKSVLTESSKGPGLGHPSGHIVNKGFSVRAQCFPCVLWQLAF